MAPFSTLGEVTGKKLVRDASAPPFVSLSATLQTIATHTLSINFCFTCGKAIQSTPKTYEYDWGKLQKKKKKNSISQEERRERIVFYKTLEILKISSASN